MCYTFLYTCRFAVLLLFMFMTGIGTIAMAQCPDNIDFEKGNFEGWFCDTGRVSTEFGPRIITLNTSPPTIDRHVMLSAAQGDRFDLYGGFPVLCPNGSGYSIKLGNALASKGAERLYYTFTIPPTKNEFSLVYNYAIVLQDPGHLPAQQPRLSIEVLNVTDNVKDTCSSFDFVVNGGLPGFLTSNMDVMGIPVRYKNWSAASINLDGKAGKTFRISFTTTDCSLGDHFGYAYIDINTDCSSRMAGTVFCPTDPSITLKAPPGFQDYRWFNNANTTLGTGQEIIFNPPPKGGDTVHVEIKPFDGYGCEQVLTAYLWDTLTVIAHAGPDREFCVNGVQLGEPPRPDIKYSWSPSTGLSNANISNPVASPQFANTQYILSATALGGGCLSTDAVSLVKKCTTIEAYVPGAFTPDNNGTNDRLRPLLIGFSKVNYFRVYNRFGQLLYSMNSDLPGWDGTIRGKPAATQTVVWVLEAIDAYGRTEKRQGTSVLIR